MKVQEEGGVYDSGGLCVGVCCHVLQLAQEGRWNQNSSCPRVPFSIKGRRYIIKAEVCGGVWRCVVVCGSVWQCVAVCRVW